LQPARLELRTSVVAGCKSVVGTVTLDAPAPAGGAIVTLADTLASATTPASLTIAAGATSGRFTIKTATVVGVEDGKVTATLAGQTLQQPLTVRPIGLSSLTVKPSSVAGGNTVAGKATLECKAGPGPITVDLASNNPAVAAPVAANLVVAQGTQSVTFDVATSPVLSASTARLTGSANGIDRSRTLTILPAASVSPNSLPFGNQAVGTTSLALNATLTNKGTVAFAVTDIALTGSYASWFAQSHDCPPNLSPGASCTIGVTFTPVALGKKSAKLSISTGATTTPLTVSLSGTGI
jgi:trimeric autotransporter adhesin